MIGSSKRDNAKLNQVRGDRRLAAGNIRALLDRSRGISVSAARLPELEHEQEILLLAYQTLMKPSMLSPFDRRVDKETQKLLGKTEQQLIEELELTE